MLFKILIILISFYSFNAAHAQFHKSSVNLFKQQTKAIQRALPVDCPDDVSSDSTNAFTQNINHPCVPARKKTNP